MVVSNYINVLSAAGSRGAGGPDSLEDLAGVLSGFHLYRNGGRTGDVSETEFCKILDSSHSTFHLKLVRRLRAGEFIEWNEGALDDFVEWTEGSSAGTLDRMVPARLADCQACSETVDYGHVDLSKSTFKQGLKRGRYNFRGCYNDDPPISWP